MVHVFKAGSGDWEKDGVKYDAKCVNDVRSYLADGYSLTLSEAINKVTEEVTEEAPKKQATKAKANDKKD